MLSSVVPSSPSKSCSDALDVNIAEITAHIVLFLYTADFDQDQVHDAISHMGTGSGTNLAQNARYGRMTITSYMEGTKKLGPLVVATPLKMTPQPAPHNARLHQETGFFTLINIYEF